MLCKKCKLHMLATPTPTLLGPVFPASPLPYCPVQRFMVSQVSANVDLSPVGRVTLVQQLQNSISLATGAGEPACAVPLIAVGLISPATRAKGQSTVCTVVAEGG